MDWIFPLLWLLLAILFIVLEALTFNLITIWFAAGALSSMFVAIATPDNLTLQIIVFLAISILALVTIRRYAMNKMSSQSIKTNVNSIIGRKVIVTKKIEPYNFGEVKIDGNYWTAKSIENKVIEEGSIVNVVEVSGVKLLVKDNNDK